MSSLDGQSVWRDLWNRLDDQTRRDYFRLNIDFPGPDPPIDDANLMDELSERVRLDPTAPHQRHEAVIALLASCFFLKLNALPSFQGGLWHCRGTIRCRIRGSAVITALQRLCGSPLTFTLNGDSLKPGLSSDDICSACYRYSTGIEFLVRRFDDPILLNIHWGPDASRRIGGFPNTVQWFIDQQNLQRPFGCSNHGVPHRLICPKCESSQTSRKRLRDSPQQSPRKRV